MAFDFKNVYNKAFAEPGTKINKKLNKVIGKEVFQDIKKMEDPKEYPPLSDYPEYDVPEPPQWTLLTGEQKVFPLEGETITISKNLDICMKYLDLFKSSAQYYMERFMFQYNNCVKDYDTLLNYFQEMYLTGLHPMMERASSLLLPFDVFNVSVEDFFEYQINTYNRAVQSWNTMLEIEEKRNQQAAQLGDQIGGSIRMQGGGFGFRGAMKGVAKAEIFNIGMAGIGKYFANQTRMSDEEKANIYAKFKKDIFFNVMQVIISNAWMRRMICVFFRYFFLSSSSSLLFSVSKGACFHINAVNMAEKAVQTLPGMVKYRKINDVINIIKIDMKKQEVRV